MAKHFRLIPSPRRAMRATGCRWPAISGARLSEGLVAQGDAADHQRSADKAADAFGQIRVVIAEDPVPVAALLQRRQFLAILGAEPSGELAAVKAVAERNHPARCKMVEAGGKALQRAPRVVRGASCPAPRRPRPSPDAGRRRVGCPRTPSKGAGRDRQEGMAGELDRAVAVRRELQ